MKKIWLGFSLLVVFLFVVACNAKQPAESVAPAAESAVQVQIIESTTAEKQTVPGNKLVEINNDKFNPVNLEVQVGEKVEWLNKEGVTHTVSLENGDFDEEVPAGAVVSYKFMEKGEFRYFCRFHSGMQGSILVK